MALLFTNGTAQRVNVGSAVILDDLTASSVMAWIYPTSIVANTRIVDKGAATGFFNLNIAGGGTARLSFFIDYNTTDAGAQSADNVLVANIWQCAAATCDGTNAPKLYWGALNVPMAETAYTAATQTAPSGGRVTDNTTVMALGSTQTVTAARTFPGVIAWVGVWNRALSPVELIDLQMNPRPTSGCVGSWRLGLKGAALQLDESGYSNHGTIVSGVTYTTATVPLLAMRQNLVPHLQRYPYVAPAAGGVLFFFQQELLTGGMAA